MLWYPFNRELYWLIMTKRERLLERIATLPEKLPDEVTQSIEDILAWHQSGVYRLSDDERQSVQKGMNAARRGEFASDDEIAGLYSRHSPARLAQER
jgi:predicted transcriptional regulator